MKPLFPQTNKKARGAAHKIINDVQTKAGPPVLSLHQWLHPRAGQSTSTTPSQEQPPTAASNAKNPAIHMPRDKTLDKMDIILKQTLRGLTIDQFYEWVWKEQKGPLYQPWLEESGKQQVHVHDWKACSHVGSWDREEYQEERMVQFEFVRTTHLYTGPPVAQVSHTHQGRLDYDTTTSNDDKIPIRCIVAMTVEMNGIPFADCFNVQIRWVVTRDSLDDKMLHIQVGLFVNFVQHTIVAGKIRSGTSEETAKGQLSLFQHIQKYCSAQVPAMESVPPIVRSGRGEAEAELQEEQRKSMAQQSGQRQPVCFGLFSGIGDCFPKRQSSIQAIVWDNDDDEADEYYAKDDPVMKRVRQAEIKLKLFRAKYQMHQSVGRRNLLEPRDSAREHSKKQIQWIESELTDIHASLDGILRELKHLD